MRTLDAFILHIEDFLDIPASSKIDYFGYYLTIDQEHDGFIAKDITNCFEQLNLHPYSNISSYLSKNTKGSHKKFIKRADRFYLERRFKERLDSYFGDIPLPKASDSTFLPLELFDNTRGYIQQISEQTINCYDLKLFDACSMLIRKLLEVLIIECFERHKIDELIKKDGTFYYLSDLISELLQEPKWNISRNAKQSLPKIKKLGDLSAHNRRYFARKNDIDEIKHDLRIILEELIHIVDYKTWK